MSGIIAIEFNESAIKIAEGKRKGKTLDISKLQIIPTPSGAINDGRLQGKDAADILKKHLAEHYFTNNKSLFQKNASIVISPACAITRQLTLPPMDGGNLAPMVKYELKEFLPSDVDEYIINHRNLGETRDTDGINKMRIFAAALPEQIVRDYFTFCESLKLKPSSLRINSESAQKVYEFCGSINGIELSNLNTAVLLDIGFSGSHLHLFRNCRLEMSNAISLGAKHVIEAIAAGFDASVEEAAAELEDYGSLAVSQTNTDLSEQQKHIEALNNIIKSNVDVLADEARQIITYYTSRAVGYKIDHIFIYGDAACIDKLDVYLSERLNISVSRVNHLDGIRDTPALQNGIYKFVNVIGALIS